MQVFDLLLSMADFQAFKDLMVSYKQQAAQASPLALTCHAAPVHHDEQEDGEERPDLDLSLTVSPMVSPTNQPRSRPAQHA